jgi:hypothetical protein
MIFVMYCHVQLVSRKEFTERALQNMIAILAWNNLFPPAETVKNLMMTFYSIKDFSKNTFCVI